ncbi:MAG: hypothetical protein A3J94_14490 [Syntrophus sp. RIFOXYC2_FULL_54_9]|nr:MAG: hypothetical protein A3J94_14490 [Syntrophus sp. RIFOXYC2_FULL_54_9]
MPDLSVGDILKLERLHDGLNFFILPMFLAGVREEMKQRVFLVRPEIRKHQVVNDSEIIEGGC